MAYPTLILSVQIQIKHVLLYFEWNSQIVIILQSNRDQVSQRN